MTNLEKTKKIIKIYLILIGKDIIIGLLKYYLLLSQ